MALKPGDVANFETLKRAAANGDLALECKDKKTGRYRAVIVAIGRDGDEYLMTPFGHLTTGDPFKLYTPPEPVET